MSKLILLKSDHDNEKIGEYIVRVDKIIGFSFFERTDELNDNKICYGIVVLCEGEGNSFKLFFRDKNNLFNAAHDLFNALGGTDTSMVDNMAFQSRDSIMKDRKELLKSLLS